MIGYRVMIALNLLTLLVSNLYAAAPTVDAMSQEIYQAYQQKKPMPNLSKKYELDMSLAYQVQKSYVRSRLQSEHIAGFKAGLTSDEAQSSFNINRPIIGILFKEGQKQDNSELVINDYRGLMIEAELGFIFDRKISKKVNSVDELKSYVQKIVPVLELPEVHFESTLTEGVDLVAINTGSAYFIPSDTVNWLGQDINDITVTLRHDDRIVLQGQGRDALGDQWEALRWLVNQVIAHGWSIEKGYLLITGALGGMVDVQPGVYKALYNNETTVSFTVNE